jgi:ADP-heptose:LPS heptosyltransferase
VSESVRDRTAVAAGTLSLPGALALMTRGALLLTNDSGPLHLAWALGVPTVSLWGPGTPRSYGPLGEGHTVITRDVPCSPCLYFTDRPPCGGVNVCMTSILEEEVIAACEERLAS